MNSDERREARRQRRESARQEKRAERLDRCTIEEVADLGNLYSAAKKSSRGVSWKSSVQRYQIDVLRNCAKARRDLLSGADIRRGFHEFDLFERGKLRHISSVPFSERVIHKSLSTHALVPALTPSFIADNSANTKGRGTDYAIMRIKKQLAKHYRLHGSEGYILLCDFSDYFASIAHEPVKQIIASSLDDRMVIRLAHSLVDACGSVGLGLGSEPNQVCAVAFPSRIDHYVTEMLGVEAYGRYMDDSYCIHESKEYLDIVMLLMRRECAKLGITVN